MTHTQRGGAAVELVIVTPLLLAVALFVVGLGRLGTAREAVDGAARDGAREASIARSAAAADAAARQIVASTLAEKRVSCSNMRVDVDTTRLKPVAGAAGTVAVRVDCTVANHDVIVSGLPGSSTLSGRFVAVVDAYRGMR